MEATRLIRGEWEVRDLDIAIAHRIVRKFHYARGASNTAVYLHGLFRKGDIFQEQCQGLAWWIPPTRSCAEATYPANWKGVLSLSRLVILPGVPSNACTYLLSQSRKLIPKDVWPCLLTYADEFRGHTGAIYKADNWQMLGLTKPQPVYVLRGVMIARKAGPKTRSHSQMLALGCELVGKFRKHKFVMIRKD